MATVEFENVGKSYGAVEALSGFDLHVADGDFCVFVGPSGCGKSTALKMLAGLEATTTGTIHIGGRDITDLGPGRRDVAMVFQNYALYPHMTVAANMSFPLRMRGVPKAAIAARVREAAEMLELTDYLDRRPRALSGGQRQRVALGRAVVREPSAFLMDEPLSNLDAKLRVQTRAEIVRLQRRVGTTTIYVTHDQTEALTMASRIVVMRGGRIQQVGTPDDLFHRPANAFVAGFIGSPGMNFFDGRLRDGLGHPVTSFAGADIALPKVSGAPADALLGIRPEHIAVGGEGPALRLSLVENLGTEKILHFDMPEGGRRGSLVARVIDDRRFTEGETLPLHFPPDKLHVFDPRTEMAIG